MKLSKILMILAVAVCFCAPVIANPVFTGDVGNDIAGFEGYVADDPNDVGYPAPIPATGNELLGVAWHYDADLDNGTLFIGFDIDGIAGDVDGDGNPNNTSSALQALYGFDCPDSGIAESFTFSLDLDNDGDYDIIAGIDTAGTWDDFMVVEFDGSPYAPAFAFGSDITGIGGELFNYTVAYDTIFGPSTDEPDIEFTITGINGYDGFVMPGEFQAFIGSFADAGIGEDFLTGQIHTPEPAEIMLISAGLVSLAGIARKRIAKRRAKV